MNKHIAFIIPDGVGIKNYLYSSLISNLIRNNAKITLIHNFPEKIISEIEEIHKKKIDSIPLLDYKELLITKFYRELICLSRLKRNIQKTKNKTLITNWNPNLNSIKHKFFYLIISLLSSIVFRNYKLILWLEKMQLKTIKSEIYKPVFKNKIDLIFCTHQRSLPAIPYIHLAKQFGIKTIGVIFSWDNLPKARLSVRTDEYVVWSPLMKKDMNFFYPEIDIKKIHITGTPQFEFHTKKQFQQSKKDFFRKYNLDINKKTICFSGDDRLTSPYDPSFLEDLCSSLNNFPENERPQIIFRRCPVDLSDRYDAILEKYKDDIAVINPDWRIENPSQDSSFTMIYPSYNDISLLVNTCLHSDVVVNLGSTMAHDFAVHNKPCLYVNYNPIKDKNWSVEMIYKFEHFKSMDSLDAVGWVNEKSDFYQQLKIALENPQLIAVDKEKWLRRIVEHPLNKNSINLANLILDKCTSAI